MEGLVKAMLFWTNAQGAAGPPIVAMVNPEQLSLDKSVQHAEVSIPGLDAPILQFVAGQAETMNVELFFDTTDTGLSVTMMTDQVYGLAKIDPSRHAPPICIFAWGPAFPGRMLGLPATGGNVQQAPQGRSWFKCVITSVQQRFTMFDAVGVPLRAEVTVALKEYRPVHEQLDQIGFQSNDHTRQHVVQAGEHLAGIAALVLGDATRWRAIADHNGIDNPLAITPGTVLELPVLL